MMESQGYDPGKAEKRKQDHLVIEALTRYIIASERMWRGKSILRDAFHGMNDALTELKELGWICPEID